MATLIDFGIHLAVERSGLPRVGRYDDGSQKVLYLNDGGIVQTLTAAEWLTTRGPLPAEPTPEEISAALAAIEAARASLQTRRNALRARLRGGMLSAVGADVAALTTPQLLALVRVLAQRAGAFDDDGLLLPYDQWVPK